MEVHCTVRARSAGIEKWNENPEEAKAATNDLHPTLYAE
jgi:hypothetical protein